MIDPKYIIAVPILMGAFLGFAVGRAFTRKGFIGAVIDLLDFGISSQPRTLGRVSLDLAEAKEYVQYLENKTNRWEEMVSYTSAILLVGWIIAAIRSPQISWLFVLAYGLAFFLVFMIGSLTISRPLKANIEALSRAFICQSQEGVPRLIYRINRVLGGRHVRLSSSSRTLPK